MEDDGVAERQHGAEVMAAMDNVLLKLQDLSDELSAQGEDAKKTDELESSICKAIYDLGNAASTPETRMMGSFLPSTARFVETTSGGWLREGYHSDGVVVKARDSETGETVALKTLEFDDDDDEEEKAFISYHVLREACFMAACRGHPSLVGLSGIARHPDTGDYSLVMENVGPRLYDVLQHARRGKPFPEHRVRRVMRQVLSGAKAMHDRGVVHHSIHSMNIFVADGGGKDVVKIGDYSDAMSVSETTVGFAARLSHVAPECFLEPGRDNDEAMDSWSMGCLMLELLTGVDHFGAGLDDDENDAEVRLQRIDDVLGLSDERIMEASMNKLAVDVELSPEVQRYRVQWRGDRLRELVPREALSDRGLAVLQGLLMYSPKGRLTASSALRHPWFTDDTFNRSKPRRFTWVLVGVVALFSLMVFVCHRRRWC